MDHAFGVSSKKSSPNSRSSRCSPMLSSRSFILDFTFSSVIYFMLIFVKDVGSVSRFIFFARGCLVFPAPFVENSSSFKKIISPVFLYDRKCSTSTRKDTRKLPSMLSPPYI